MASEIPYITFSNGRKCPLLGLGTWKSQPGEVTQAVKDAIDIGYRHFDCAHVYQNEKEVGQAIQEKIKEGVVKREDLFITSKLWNTYHKKEMVLPALKTTLSNLGLTYVDLYLIHWPMAYKEGDVLFPKDENDKLEFSDTSYTETWMGMEGCSKAGLAKSLGVSNFNSEQVQDILNIASVIPVTNQVEAHVYLNQQKLLVFCRSKNIALTAYSPLGSPDRPGADASNLAPLKDPKVNEIAKKYKRGPGQVLIKFQLQRGLIVIPKSVNKSRIQENFEVFGFEISPTDMKELEALDCNGRLLVLETNKEHRDYPFNKEF